MPRPGGAALTVKLAGGTTRLGDALRVAFPPGRLHVFDRGTGLRIEPLPG